MQVKEPAAPLAFLDVNSDITPFSTDTDVAQRSSWYNAMNPADEELAPAVEEHCRPAASSVQSVSNSLTKGSCSSQWPGTLMVRYVLPRCTRQPKRATPWVVAVVVPDVVTDVLADVLAVVVTDDDADVDAVVTAEVDAVVDADESTVEETVDDAVVTSQATKVPAP